MKECIDHCRLNDTVEATTRRSRKLSCSLHRISTQSTQSGIGHLSATTSQPPQRALLAGGSQERAGKIAVIVDNLLDQLHPFGNEVSARAEALVVVHIGSCGELQLQAGGRRVGWVAGWAVLVGSAGGHGGRQGRATRWSRLGSHGELLDLSADCRTVAHEGQRARRS